MKNIEKIVSEYKTKYKYGFTKEEILDVLKNFPKINMTKFHEATFGDTCEMVDGDLITFHCDLKKALRCGIENRDLRFNE